MSIFWGDCFKQVSLHELLNDETIILYRDYFGNSMLHALFYSFPQQAFLSIKNKANLVMNNNTLNIQNRDLKTPLMIYVEKFQDQVDDEQLKWIIANFPIDFKATDMNGENICMKIAQYCGTNINEVICEHLKKNADLLSCKTFDGQNIVHFAFKNIKVDVFNLYCKESSFSELLYERNNYGFSVIELAYLMQSKKEDFYLCIKEHITENIVNDPHPIYGIPLKELVKQNFIYL